MATQAQSTQVSPVYRGSLKHKDRPGEGAKGTLCPEWTHKAGTSGFAGDPFAHNWSLTQAHTLFGTATIWSANGRRYATSAGIAFEAKPTADGTWHGYPIPWQSVPAKLVNEWLAENKIAKKDLKLSPKASSHKIGWALNIAEP